MDKRQKITLCFQRKITKVPSSFTVQKCIDRMVLSNHLEDLQEALAGPGRLSGMPSGSSRTLARLIFQILNVSNNVCSQLLSQLREELSSRDEK